MLKVGAIVWGVRDVERAVSFWTAALDYVPKGEVSDDWAMPSGQAPYPSFCR